jgi:hypothetical protein
MLYTQKVLAELEARAARFAGYQRTFDHDLGVYREALASLGARYRSAAAVVATQAGLMEGESAGAVPTGEYDAWRAGGGAGVPVRPFGQAFAHHEAARAWAEGVRGITTFAVDGSQLMPWRDASIPVALVQAGLFENPHRPPDPYIKDVEVAVLTPDDLLRGPGGGADRGGGSDGEDGDDGGTALDAGRRGEETVPAQAIVHLHRFQLEARVLIARMEHHAARPEPERLVVGFLDGSLIVSFALKMAAAYREAYVDTARALLDASARCRVPLVAYIDTSYARDVVSMLRHLPMGDATIARAGAAAAGADLPAARGVHDALLWHHALAWGDRSPAFLSARGDVLGAYGAHGEAIAFVAFQAALDRPPVRLEFPRWVLEAGLLDRVMDAVRAEVIAGNGYPYPLEAADAVAVISMADRAQFYAQFQKFAERQGLGLSFSRKALSKSRRRV